MARKVATLDGPTMTHAEKVTCINAAWCEIRAFLVSLSDRAPLEAFEEATAVAAQQEKQHRALGRRLVGKIRPRTNVKTAARLMVVRAFMLHEWSLFSGPDIVHTRRDILLAKACRACLTPTEALWLSSRLVQRTGNLDLASLDYCDIVAEVRS